MVGIGRQGRVLVVRALVEHPEESAGLPVRHLLAPPGRQYAVEALRPDVLQRPHDRLEFRGLLHSGHTAQQRRHNAAGPLRQRCGGGLRARGVIAGQVREKGFDLHAAAHQFPPLTTPCGGGATP